MMKLINYRQAGDTLGVSTPTVRRWVGDGRIAPPVHIGEVRVGFPDYEVEDTARMIVAGKTADELRTNVKGQIKARELPKPTG